MAVLKIGHVILSLTGAQLRTLRDVAAGAAKNAREEAKRVYSATRNRTEAQKHSTRAQDMELIARAIDDARDDD